MSLRLHTIITSTRPGRIGPAVASWFHEFSQDYGRFEAHLVDLKDFNLPIYDEPQHPRSGQYQHEHTKRWSESVKAADAVVFVMPEYNHMPPPSFTNAVNFVYWEWFYKPAGFVTYGGVSGGLRAMQSARLQVTGLKMMPIPECVALPGVLQQMKDGAIKDNEWNKQAAQAMLNELHRWSEVLAPLRKEVRAQGQTCESDGLRDRMRGSLPRRP